MPNFKTLTLEYAHSKVSMAVSFPHLHVHLFLLEYDHVAPYFHFVSFHVYQGIWIMQRPPKLDVTTYIAQVKSEKERNIFQ